MVRYKTYPTMHVPYQIGDQVMTSDGRAIVRVIYPDGDMALTWGSDQTMYTLSPWQVWFPTARAHRVQKRPLKTKTKRSQKLKKQKCASRTYHKDRTPSKDKQNDGFVQALQRINVACYAHRVLVLDTKYCRSIDALRAIGVWSSRIYVPQPDADEAQRIKRQHPTVRVYPGIKAGDLIWQLANTSIKFSGLLLDYCGMPGDRGHKNTPLDDVENVFRYNLLEDQSVVTCTICARSCQRTTEKFSEFKRLVSTFRTLARQYGMKLSRLTTMVYTDPGSQTMCHVRFVLTRRWNAPLFHTTLVFYHSWLGTASRYHTNL